MKTCMRLSKAATRAALPPREEHVPGLQGPLASGLHQAARGPRADPGVRSHPGPGGCKAAARDRWHAMHQAEVKAYRIRPGPPPGPPPQGPRPAAAAVSDEQRQTARETIALLTEELERIKAE